MAEVIIDQDAVKNMTDEMIITGLERVGIFLDGEVQVRAPKKTGLLKGSIFHVVDRVKQSVRIIANTEYAAIQEFGGETNPKVTERMRKWAWAMWYETKNKFYKNLALTKKDSLKVHVPARPYLGPALFNNLDRITEVFVSGSGTKIGDKQSGKRS